MMRIAMAGVALLGLLACGGGTTTGVAACDEDMAAPLRILFVGNSLTYSNGLPYMVRSLADSAGEQPPVVDDVTLPDFGLQEHWNEGSAERAIRGGCWDYVVLQQGPSSLPESRTILLDYAGRFADITQEKGARPALLSAWPAKTRRGDFERAIESYALAAEAVDGVMLPAATAWLETWAREPGLELYRDNLHPSREGTYLTALVIIGRLYGRAPASMPAGVSVRAPGWNGAEEMRIDPATAAVLKQAAQAALDAYPPD